MNGGWDAWVARGALVLALAAVLAWSVAFWSFTIDDTYITARYAEKLAAGEGLVFNAGERVEGFSCPSWVVVLGVADLVGLDPVATAKIIGVLSALLIVLVTYAALARSGTSRPLVAVATLWVASVAGIGVYAPSGMETVPFTLAVLLLSATPFLDLPARARAALMGASVLLVATLRPEGVPLAVSAASLWLAVDRERSVRRGIGAALVVLAALLVFRFIYYESWLPNTYLAKPSTLLAAAGTAGFPGGLWLVVRELVAGAGPRELFGAAGGPLLLLFVALAIARRPGDTRLWPALLATLVGWVFVAYAPADWMPAARFATPFVPAAILLAARGADDLVQLHRSVRIALTIATGIWLAWQATTVNELHRSYSEGRVNPALDARAFADIGEWLSTHATPEDRVLAYEIGAVGYLSKCAIVDHEGLIAPDIAEVIHEAGGYTPVRFGHRPDAMRQIVRICQARRPDWFLVRTSKRFSPIIGQPVPSGVANEPIQNALLQALGPSMVLRASFDLPAPPGIPERYLLLGRIR